MKSNVVITPYFKGSHVLGDGSIWKSSNGASRNSINGICRKIPYPADISLFRTSEAACVRDRTIPNSSACFRKSARLSRAAARIRPSIAPEAAREFTAASSIPCHEGAMCATVPSGFFAEILAQKRSSRSCSGKRAATERFRFSNTGCVTAPVFRSLTKSPIVRAQETSNESISDSGIAAEAPRLAYSIFR